MDRVITIARFCHAHEAHLARSLLESHGIEATVANENVALFTHPGLIATHGVELRILAGDAPAALEVLRPEGYPIVEPPVPRADPDACPRCGGASIQRSRRLFESAIFILRAVIGVPSASRRWECRRCGADWKT